MNPEKTYPKFYLYNRIVHAKLFIDRNFHQNIILDHIADEAFFSKFHFIRLFKNIYGKTPHQYLTSVRIENAKKNLEEGASISETCYRVGFDSMSCFSVLFKKWCKLSPAEYQRLYQRRQQALKSDPLRFIPNCFAEQKGWLEKSNFQEMI